MPHTISLPRHMQPTRQGWENTDTALCHGSGSAVAFEHEGEGMTDLLYIKRASIGTEYRFKYDV